MIIQIRGTSGSGKTTVMREVMDRLAFWRAHYIEGRKKPIWYRHPDNVLVLGHYESACGGCDNVGSARAVYDLINERTDPLEHVVCEGLLLSEDTKWTRQLEEDGEDVRVLFLTTDVEECIERVKRRRKEAGNDKPLNETNTRNRVAVIERARVKLMAAADEGATIHVRRASTSQASRIILKWLGFTPTEGR